MEEKKLKEWEKQQIPRIGICPQCQRPVMLGESFVPEYAPNGRMIPVHGLCSYERQGCKLIYENGVLHFIMPEDQ